MGYIKNYKSFIKEQKKYIKEQSILISKEIHNDLNSNFWNLCLESELFDIHQKNFIKEELMHNKVDINEKWEFLDKAYNYVKDKGEKFMNAFQEKIKKIISGIGGFIKGVLIFCKNIFLGMFNGAMNLGKKLSTEKKSEIEGKLKSADKDTISEEVPNLKQVFNYLRTGDVKGDAIAATGLNSNFGKKVTTTFEASESNIKSTTLTELEETENKFGDDDSGEESKKESFLQYEKGDDIINHFYEYSIILEAEVLKGESSSALTSLIEWFKSFIEKKPDPEISAGKKLVWWGRLILRITSSFFGIIVKVAELVGEIVTNASLSFVSKISKWLGGPGPFKFVALGSIVGALVGIVGDVCLLVGATPFPGMEAAMDMKKWFLAAFNLYASTDPVAKIIKVLLTVTAIGFAIYHIHHTLHSLKGHGEHVEKHNDQKEEKKIDNEK